MQHTAKITKTVSLPITKEQLVKLLNLPKHAKVSANIRHDYYHGDDFIGVTFTWDETSELEVAAEEPLVIK